MAKEIKEVTRVKHKARQSTYEVLGAAPMQVSEGVAQNRVGAMFGKKARQVVDGELLVVYRSESTGDLYVCHPDEFTHDRFEEMQPMSFDVDATDRDAARQEGITATLSALANLIGADPDKIVWDAATETEDGDVLSVMCSIFRAKFGENWYPDGMKLQSDNKSQLFEPIVFEQEVSDGNTTFEDGRRAMIVELNDRVGGPPDTEDGMFVRIQSWDQMSEHPELKFLSGAKVRVTIEDASNE